MKTLSENLIKKGYGVKIFETAEACRAYLDSQIDGKTVGFGGSVTLEQLALYPALAAHNEVYWHQGVTDKAESFEQRRKASTAEIYLSSVNAISETGEIINIDGNCNRVSAILYGHEKVYLIAGKNKIAENYEKALYRARNVAAPLNAKRLNRKTPCVKDGVCHDCKSPERICRALSVLWEKPMAGEFEVLLVEEALGY